MLLANARRQPSQRSRLAEISPTPVWRDLPLEHQTNVAHVLAVLVRRIRQQPQPDSRSEPLENSLHKKGAGEGP
jgi:hypothetical protein